MLNRFKNIFLITLLSLVLYTAGHELKAQQSHKVLFLGNSYTGVNNLPQLVHDVALSVGDTLIFDSHTPGGYQLIDHSADATSQAKIMTGGWDYVVIQGQSQEPVILNNDFTSGGIQLYNQIKEYNPCAVTLPYMTWGRKNGDASNCGNFPVMCTYEGMDTTIRDEYLNLTSIINGEVSPVSVVWKYIRQNYPGIELYHADESHPSPAGSYAAACCFYAAIFKNDPSLITFNFGLDSITAENIRDAAKAVAFDSLQLWDFKKLPRSNFIYHTGPGSNEVIFNALSEGADQTYDWDFGDGGTDTIPNPIHSYAADGTYTVSLTTSNCDLQGLHTSFTDTVIQFCSHTPTVYTSHPWLCWEDTLWTEPADSYQWIYNGPIPEYNQYLAGYEQYGISGFSVMSTVNGCTELSQPYTESVQWSGYYFDAMGNPCTGDTVRFIVLHINGFLSGQENILWFKNDTLMSLMTNEDTLLITTEGKYECKVIDPNSDCPQDTTGSSVEYECTTAGIKERGEEIFLSLYPNPASEMVSIQFSKSVVRGELQIYNAIGILIKTVSVSSTKINVADLPSGIYYLRLKNNNGPALKFIKL